MRWRLAPPVRAHVRDPRRHVWVLVLAARPEISKKLRLLADENFNGSIIRGLLRRKPEMEVVRVQDVGLSGADDRLVLAWAAHAGRVLLTHDQKTVPTYAYERVMAGLPMPGVFIGDTYLLVQQAIEDIVLLVERSEEHEWEGQVRYLPLSGETLNSFFISPALYVSRVSPISSHER